MTPRRRSARLAAAVGLLALAGPALYPPAAATAATSANANVSAAAVLDGSARFEVLTPTLIRMEYAGDSRFQDSETFNAVNRSFSAVSFTTSVSNGYRVISTGSITLRYKEGSGPFTAANTSITVAGTNATAAPSFPSYCVFGTACEAEDGLLRNPQSGRCLDDPNNNEKAGDLLQIYDCDNTVAQQFSLGG